MVVVVLEVSVITKRFGLIFFDFFESVTKILKKCSREKIKILVLILEKFDQDQKSGGLIFENA